MENTENKFKYNGLWYIAVEQSGCRNCAFNTDNPRSCKLDAIDAIGIELPGCSKIDRRDKRNVIFVESDIDNKGIE
jgi:hypothetical protein